MVCVSLASRHGMSAEGIRGTGRGDAAAHTWLRLKRGEPTSRTGSWRLRFFQSLQRQAVITPQMAPFFGKSVGCRGHVDRERGMMQRRSDCSLLYAGYSIPIILGDNG